MTAWIILTNVKQYARKALFIMFFVCALWLSMIHVSRAAQDPIEFSLIFAYETYVGNMKKIPFIFRSNSTTVDDLLTEVHTAVNIFHEMYFQGDCNKKQILDSVLEYVQSNVFRNKLHFKEQIDRLREMNEDELLLKGWIHSTALTTATATHPKQPLQTSVHRSVASFDIFDTILARDVHEPTDIFKIIENEFPFPMFYFYRRLAENIRGGSFDSIYKTFQNITKADDDTIQRLKQFEIETEINHSYLILQTYDRIKDGDILVSDMYLPPEAILRMLLHAGFNKKVDIFVSSGGKAQNGWIYQPLKRRYNISLHVGDNYNSDVVNARAHNVVAEHTTIHAALKSEVSLHTYGGESGKRISQLLRRFRLEYNPFPVKSSSSEMFLEQAAFNIPLLLFSAQRIVRLMKKEGLTRLLLSTRDGCLMEKIFSTLYPDVDALRFQTSRFIYRHPTDEYKTYLKEIYIPKKTLIFDILGCFASGRRLFVEMFGELPRVEYIVAHTENNSIVDDLMWSNGTLTSMLERLDDSSVPLPPWSFGADVLEDLNLDVVGPLSQVYTFKSDWEMNRILPGYPNSEHPNHKRLFFRGPNAYYILDDIRFMHSIVDLFTRFVTARNVSLLREDLDNCNGDVIAWEIYYFSQGDFKFEFRNSIVGLRGKTSHHYHLVHNKDVEEWETFGSSVEVALKPYFDRQINILLICDDEGKDESSLERPNSGESDSKKKFTMPFMCGSYNFLVHYLGPFACYFKVSSSTIHSTDYDAVLSSTTQNASTSCLRPPQENQEQEQIYFDIILHDAYYDVFSVSSSLPHIDSLKLQPYLKEGGQVMYRTRGHPSAGCDMKDDTATTSDANIVSTVTGDVATDTLKDDTCFRCHEGRCGICFFPLSTNQSSSHLSCFHNCLCIHRKRVIP